MKTMNRYDLKMYYLHYDVEIVEIEPNEFYVCDNKSWDGEKWSNCWQLDENYNVVNECEIKDVGEFIYDEFGDEMYVPKFIKV